MTMFFPQLQIVRFDLKLEQKNTKSYAKLKPYTPNPSFFDKNKILGQRKQFGIKKNNLESRRKFRFRNLANLKE